MKKYKEDPEDDLLPEYDFHSLRVVARGPGRKKPGEITIALAPDVAQASQILTRSIKLSAS